MNTLGRTFTIMATALVVLLPMQSALAQFAGGAGTVGDPWQISNCSELEEADNLDTYYDDHFILINDIDCAGEPGSGYPLWPRANQGGRQDGIGAFGGAYSFGGTFDGQGFSIANRSQSFLNTQRPPKGGTPAVYRNIVFTNMFITNHPLVQLTGYVGGVMPAMYTGANPSFFNIHVHGIVSNMTGSGNTGGMIANCSGVTISNCSANVAVYGGGSVGGLVGTLSGASSVMTGSHAYGDVNGTAGTVGGLIGSLTGGSVYQCSAHGDVFRASGEYVGGLIGGISGACTVRECFATGDVSHNTAQGGGFVGLTIGGQTVLIEDCYSTGDNSGSDNGDKNGGFVGSYARTTTGKHVINRCYSAGDVLMASGNGFVGNGGGANGNYVSNSFVSATTVLSSTRGFSSGLQALNVVNCFWTNSASGVDASGATKVSNESYFYDTANAPVDGWNSTTIWCFTGDALPCLRWDEDCCPPPKGSVVWFE